MKRRVTEWLGFGRQRKDNDRRDDDFWIFMDGRSTFGFLSVLHGNGIQRYQTLLRNHHSDPRE